MTITIPQRTYLTPGGRGLGAKASTPDPRDRLVAAPPPTVAGTYPPVASLRASVPEIYDQGNLADCVQNSFAMLYRLELRRLGLPDLRPDRLFLYYETRRIEGSAGQNTGTAPRDTLKVMQKTGIPPESDWPYDTSRFAQQPPQQAYDDAPAHKLDSYAQVSPVLDAMRALIVAKKAFTIAFNVFQSFEGQQAMSSGIVPMPDIAHERLLGGHQIVGVGYDDPHGLIECPNSWSDKVGDGGFFWLPYEMVLDPKLCWEFWTGTVAAPVPSPTPTPAPKPTNRFKTTEYLNLRQGPGINQQIVDVIAPGIVVVADGQRQQATGYEWAHLTQTPSGAGWVADQYLAPA